jgi:hypothetical protein
MSSGEWGLGLLPLTSSSCGGSFTAVPFSSAVLPARCRSCWMFPSLSIVRWGRLYGSGRGQCGEYPS